jgi:hypothetical protein
VNPGKKTNCLLVFAILDSRGSRPNPAPPGVSAPVMPPPRSACEGVLARNRSGTLGSGVRGEVRWQRRERLAPPTDRTDRLDDRAIGRPSGAGAEHAEAETILAKHTIWPEPFAFVGRFGGSPRLLVGVGHFASSSLSTRPTTVESNLPGNSRVATAARQGPATRSATVSQNRPSGANGDG